MEMPAFVRPFVRSIQNFLDSVGQMVFRFPCGQFFQSALFALWIALKGLLPKAETMILNNYFRPTTYSGAYPFSIQGLQSAVRSAKIGSF